MPKSLLALLFISCIVSGSLTICTDLETGRSWTIITSGQ